MNAVSFRTHTGQQKVSRDQILAAIEQFDKNYREIERDTGTKFAIKHDGRTYPPKRLLELASGASKRTFGGGNTTNSVFKQLGFEVVEVESHQFTTISPTHVAGKKEHAWRSFLNGEYVAIGWLENVDLTGKSLEEIEKLLEEVYLKEPDEVNKAARALERFLSLEEGDYVAIPNVNFGLFGVGVIKSGYKFKKNMHDTGAEDKSAFYSHYRKVQWVVKDYHERSDLVLEGEKSWQPYGTIGKIEGKLPPYIVRLINPSALVPAKPVKHDALQPDFLKQVIKGIEVFRKDAGHQERDHEGLVHDFFVSIGYGRYDDVKFRRGRIDLLISSDGVQLAVVEVKRTWNLDFESAKEHIKQAYQYAHENGVRYVIVTNGDDYILFDRLKGLSWESNLLGEWKLTELREEDLQLIDRLRPERLRKPNLTELFQHLSEAFGN